MKDPNQYQLWTALITPFTPQGKIDFPALDHLLRRQEQAGIGIVLLGSTGETLGLSHEEKKLIVQRALSLKLNVPLMVGIEGINFEESLAWIRYLEEFPLDAYLMVTPLYTKPGPQGQLAWFTQLLNASTKPCMLYNVPSRTGKALEKETVLALKDHPRFWAVKEASGSIGEFFQYKSLLPKQSLYSGDDALMPHFAMARAHGLVSVASNAWPLPTLRYVERSLQGEIRDEHYQLWQRACHALFTASNPIPVKYLLHQKGLIGTSLMRLPLHQDDFHHQGLVREADAEIEAWEQSFK